MNGSPQEQVPLLHIRTGMDVYSAYQDQYVGSIIAVWHGERSSGSRSGGEARETGSAPEAVQGNPELTHEEGASVQPTGRIGRRRLGEEIGPFPTIEVGNTGPINQSAAHEYATTMREEPADVVYFAVRPGRLNLGPLTRPLYIPTTAVHSVSMERVVLAVQKDRIPREWHRRPRS